MIVAAGNLGLACAKTGRIGGKHQLVKMGVSTENYYIRPNTAKSLEVAATGYFLDSMRTFNGQFASSASGSLLLFSNSILLDSCVLSCVIEGRLKDISGNWEAGGTSLVAVG